MKTLIFPHDFGIGGSQLNAVEIAATLQAEGHECIIFGHRGALNTRIEELGLEFIQAPRPRVRPTPTIIKALVQLVDQRGIEILHGYEWPPSLECAAVQMLRPHTRCVSTVMSMSVAPFIPNFVPLIVGTEAIAAHERSEGRQRLWVQEPPVDLLTNRPELDVGQEQFRQRWGINPQALTVVLVSRLAAELKLEGILAAIKSLALIPEHLPIQLVIVGGGPEAAAVKQAAETARDQRSGHQIVLTGELLDPRAAYAVADVVLGMGGSALRGMAFGKPLVVQGERGYWNLLTSQTLPDFRWHGWYGVGSGSGAGAPALADLLTRLAEQPKLRHALGCFALQTVSEHYSLLHAAKIQGEVYEAARKMPSQRVTHLKQGLQSVAKVAAYEATSRFRTLRGKKSVDDFNAAPVMSRRPTTQHITQE